jgi:hypothetical protein
MVVFNIAILKENLLLEYSNIEEKIKNIKSDIETARANKEFDSIIELNMSLSNLNEEYNLINPIRIEKAIEILSKSNSLEYLMSYYSIKHAGDISLGKEILLAFSNQSILNSDGIQPTVNGESGKGKTHAVTTIIRLLPDLPYKKEGSLSAKGLFYMKNLPDGLIFFSDDASINNELESTLKRSMSKFQENVRHHTVINGEAATLILPKRILWLITSVNIEGSNELRNRQSSNAVDESEDQDNDVSILQLEEAGHVKKCDDIKELLTTCKTIMYIIKKQLFEVDIPYYKKIKVSKDMKKDRRNLPRFLDMIKGFCLFNFMQREINEYGQLVATIEDFNFAKEAFEVHGESQITKLSPAEIRLCKYMVACNKELTINEIVRNYRKPNKKQFAYETIRKLLQGTPTQEGLKAKVPGLVANENQKEATYLLPRLEKYDSNLISLINDGHQLQEA